MRPGIAMRPGSIRPRLFKCHVGRLAALFVARRGPAAQAGWPGTVDWRRPGHAATRRWLWSGQDDAQPLRQVWRARLRGPDAERGTSPLPRASRYTGGRRGPGQLARFVDKVFVPAERSSRYPRPPATGLCLRKIGLGHIRLIADRATGRSRNKILYRLANGYELRTIDH